ncbi:hypothetical protein CRI94_05360 [Longibacter salinarum]|uniref:Oxidoreductase n=1 Tax=Longibacter salinarum TaxID=1850348 RepID=A0A2A8D0K7_9BACT|nr:PhzF family phenazine biosynthesis protein [Longibacter salinarum]PEN14455.1 hypothetical protein CRI94_05360 [Longibacter salinarum]
MSLFQVDAFTTTPFTGNPAAVYVAPEFPSVDWMQKLAAEMNLSETAFVVPVAPTAEPAAYALRWFTPTAEVDLCGHATLATAHVIWSESDDVNHGDGSGPGAITFDTASGTLTATQTDDGSIMLDFPADPPRPASTPDGLLDALGVTSPIFVGRSERDVVVHVTAPAIVDRCQPDMKALEAIDARGIIITAAAPDAMDDADFVSRFFGPAVGVPEDPVTGSAHCALAPYWAEQLGKERLVGRQVSARGGRVGVDVSVDERVTLTGEATTVFRGTLSDPARLEV